MLSRYEMTRIMGLRALQLETGAIPTITVSDDRLRRDVVYVAALELWNGTLDVMVQRENERVHVADLRPPPELRAVLDARDDGVRPRGSHPARTGMP